MSSRDKIKEFNDKLKSEGIAEGLLIGETVPNFTLFDQEGQEHNLYDQLTKGKVVLSFYRGDWCSFCIRELNDLQNYYDEIKENNVEIWGIAPQMRENAQALSDKHHYSFPLLSDPDFSVIHAYKLDFLLSEEIQEIYTGMNLFLPDKTTDGSWKLPVPATYLISQERKVLHRFADRDYWKRLEAKELLQIIKTV